MTKVPVDKVISLSNYLSQFPWFAGMNMVDNNFPRGLATIHFRLKEDETHNFDTLFSEAFPSRLPSNLPQSYSIVLYHTPEDEDTWKPAHVPKFTPRDRRKSLDFVTLSKNGVLILGKDSGEYLIELLRVKKLLAQKGYKNAKLLKLIKDLPNQSLSQKLRLWGLLCRFSIIVDRKAGGHLNEFEMLKSQETIIAILRPTGFKSTFMMESHPKSRLLKTFEFKQAPMERISDVIAWAEEVTKDNEIYYNKEYDWRKDYL